jgi:AraC family transcriptional regulator of adaptative response/methylated-DNA-[protein]-cysteine methyltransferase
MQTLPLTPLRYDTDDQRWAAVLARQATADGHFVYAVKTTGIYARPSSSARLPQRENVVFFTTPEAAQAAGYRPNRRALADRSAATQYRATTVAAACKEIELAQTVPDLTTLARHAGLSPAHFHRLFKAETGLTPKAYASAQRVRRLRQALDTSTRTVTDAIFEAGFNANSRFYETAGARLGMPAKVYRRGGHGARIRFAVGQCTLGAILVAQSEKGICAIFLGNDPDALVRDLQDRFSQAELVGADQHFEQVVARVVGFVEQPALGLSLPLDIQGTAFQERVWQALREIPLGVTVSYSQIAERIGSPKAVRAVAQACGANRIAVAIPCHRVVRRDGDLSGYRWEIERKQTLLDCERNG